MQIAKEVKVLIILDPDLPLPLPDSNQAHVNAHLYQCERTEFFPSTYYVSAARPLIAYNFIAMLLKCQGLWHIFIR